MNDNKSKIIVFDGYYIDNQTVVQGAHIIDMPPALMIWAYNRVRHCWCRLAVTSSPQPPKISDLTGDFCIKDVVNPDWIRCGQDVDAVNIAARARIEKLSGMSIDDFNYYRKIRLPTTYYLWQIMPNATPQLCDYNIMSQFVLIAPGLHRTLTQPTSQDIGECFQIDVGI